VADPSGYQVLLTEAAVAERVEALARALAPAIDDETVVVCLLTGGVWFVADLLRALARRGRHPLFDALWLASYGDARSSGGRAEVRAGLQRPVEGRDVLIVDDVLDTGLSLVQARDHVRAQGARGVRTAVFARKPSPSAERIAPDFVAWEAPGRYLAGYGMDDAGRLRGLPFIVALD
jgi:hypoxanthine phosphoribosyltransferase